MARITVEDCVQVIPNRFDLVLAAAQRVRALGAGAESAIPAENDKRHVIALREIAAGTVDIETLRNDLIDRHRRSPADDDVPSHFDELVSAPSAVSDQTKAWQDNGYEATFDDIDSPPAEYAADRPPEIPAGR